METCWILLQVRKGLPVVALDPEWASPVQLCIAVLPCCVFLDSARHFRHCRHSGQPPQQQLQPLTTLEDTTACAVLSWAIQGLCHFVRKCVNEMGEHFLHVPNQDAVVQ